MLEVFDFGGGFDERGDGRAFFASVLRMTSVAWLRGGIVADSIPSIENVSSPSMPSDSAESPAANWQGKTPMPTRLLRWMRSKLLADDGAHAEQARAFGGPIARRSGAVRIAGENDERDGFFGVAHGGVENRQRLAVGVMDGEAAFAPAGHFVFDADIGEGAAHHHFVVAAPRAVGIEIADFDSRRLQIASGGRRRRDRSGGADVIGGDRIAENRERARAANGREAAVGGEKRRLANVSGIVTPFVARLAAAFDVAPQRQFGIEIRAVADGDSFRDWSPRLWLGRFLAATAKCRAKKRACRRRRFQAARIRNRINATGERESDDERRAHQKVGADGGWTRASKLRLPDKTDAPTRPPSATAFSMGAASGPELPMQVVQP